jgi:mono/diheme cytochrome c family protein
VVNQQGLAVVPFAIPVAVPVATVNPGGVYYGYQHQAQQFAPRSLPRSPMPMQQAETVPSRDTSPESAQPTATTTGSLVRQHCAKCHTGEAAKGGLRLDAWTSLGSDQRLKMIRRVLSDDEATRMPKGQTLDPQVLGELIQELSK